MPRKRKGELLTLSPRAPSGPICPHFLDDIARTEFERLAGRFEEIDGPALMLYAEAYSHWAQAVSELNGIDFLIEGPDGELMAHPLVEIEHNAAEQLLEISMELGLTPMSRARIEGGQ